MSDVFCKQCGQYHASLTVCPNQYARSDGFKMILRASNPLLPLVKELRDALQYILNCDMADQEWDVEKLRITITCADEAIRQEETR